MVLLTIKKQTRLLQRLPEQRKAANIDKRKGHWIIYGEHLSPSHFNDMDAFTGESSFVLQTWQVGRYDVALMSGFLTPAHETILQALKLDYADLNEVPDLTKPGLIVMDMDSTAIEIECIDEIAKLAGVGEEVAKVTELAMQGELDFEQSLRQRVATLANAPESILDEVRSSLPLMPELETMIETLQQFGWKTAIASGGFTYFSDEVKRLVNLDFATSNQLEIKDGKLTGQVLGSVVSAQTKAEVLLSLCQEYGVELHNSIAIGDGANDLAMMSVAGLGIAYHAKPKVEQQASVAIRYADLGGVVCILSGLLAKQQKISW